MIIEARLSGLRATGIFAMVAVCFTFTLGPRALGQTVIERLSNPSAEAEEYFGERIRLSGDLLGSSSSGGAEVLLFSRSADGWRYETKVPIDQGWPIFDVFENRVAVASGRRLELWRFESGLMALETRIESDGWITGPAIALGRDVVIAQFRTQSGDPTVRIFRLTHGQWKSDKRIRFSASSLAFQDDLLALASDKSPEIELYRYDGRSWLHDPSW